LPSAPARCATEISTVTTRSSASTAAAVSAKSPKEFHRIRSFAALFQVRKSGFGQQRVFLGKDSRTANFTGMRNFRSSAELIAWSELVRFGKCVRDQIRVCPGTRAYRRLESTTDYTWDIPARRTPQKRLQSIKKLHRAPLSLLRRHLA
jgi:hypothetical protein